MQNLSAKNFEKTIESHKSIIIDFYADWCGPCKRILPVLEEINDAYDAVNIFKINIDEAQQLTQDLNITSIPSLIFYKEGAEFFRHIGLIEEDECRDILDKMLSEISVE